MSQFLQRLEADIQNHRLLLRGQKILIAVSGGVDSMVLLLALHLLAPKHHWKIHVAHFNHQLRGRSSDADEKLVCKTAAALELPFVVARADVKSFAKKSKLSVEMAARKLRHEFLARSARERNIFIVALAHHADDQVELFFLRLLRGAGGGGLAGMKRHSPSPVDKTISLVRPLLDFSKSELAEFARENKIRFREDVTNACADFLRNRIRNELLPLLRKNYQPGLDQAVLRLMEIVGAEADLAGEAARCFRRSRGNEAQIKSGKRKAESGKNTRPSHDGSHKLESLPVAIQRRVLQSQLVELGIITDFELIESLRHTPNQFVSVGANISAARNASGEIKLRADGKQEFNTSDLAVDLLGRNRKVIFGGIKLTWDFKAGSQRRSPHREEFFDVDKIGGRIVLRYWQPGDRFQPIGMKSAAKLQDLFVNAKIPRERRRKLVLAATARGDIFWVEGLRIGERFKLTPQTARTLVWKWSNLDV